MNINNESNSLKQLIVSDLTPFTHLDFPDHLACIVWLVGCNMRCDFCYNKDIVFSKSGNLTLQDVLNFLETRIGLLDAIVLSGGEATTHNLIPFCKEVKKLGFKIKLDTNGLNQEQISQLIEQNLIDYIALDYKAPEYKFQNITHSNKFNNFSRTLDMLIEKHFPFEARTTIHNDLLDFHDINIIIDDLDSRGYENSYFIQKFLDTGNNIGNISDSHKTLNYQKLSNKLDIICR
ncbi:MAG: anaerobic ribonucleoside-triphosphate reductase activating protein [Campylobacterales bacterium]|nr:anaerobic ribonucleoside-triphosphate reductase activating protein [Campylobacterales bacterium]